MNADDTIIFEERLADVQTKCSDLDSNNSANRYISNRLAPLIKEGVVNPHIVHGTSTKWTNNNSESANHILKQATDWKLCTLPDLVKKLNIVVASQQKDIERALVGMGNYQLSQPYAHYRITRDQWVKLTDKARNKRLKQFINNKLKSQTDRNITSTDGTLHVLKTPSGGQKTWTTQKKKS